MPKIFLKIFPMLLACTIVVSEARADFCGDIGVLFKLAEEDFESVTGDLRRSLSRGDMHFASQKMPGADSCLVFRPFSGSKYYKCEWNYDADKSGADAAYDAFLAGILQCISLNPTEQYEDSNGRETLFITQFEGVSRLKIGVYHYDGEFDGESEVSFVIFSR